MRRNMRFAALAALLVGLGLPWTGVAVAAPPSMADVIVVLHDGEDAPAVAREMAQSHDARVGHVYEHALTGFAAEVPEGRLEGLRRDRRVAFVSPNGVVRAVADSAPNGVRRIDAPDVHALEAPVTGAGVRVAILDTGIDLDHPELANVDSQAGVNCIDATSAGDDHGHGTHVAGTVAATDGGGGIVGVAPGAALIPIKVLDASGSGTWDQVICGINHAIGLGNVDVANLSLGGPGSYDGMSCETATDALFVALCNGIDAGITFTVAAGNDAKDAAGFIPAAHPDVITVSAYSDDDGEADGTTCSGKGPWKTCDESFASFSNYGDVVDVMAPGVNIESTLMGGGTGTKSGTSMAAPHVAGVVALLLEASPDMLPGAIAAHLQDRGQCPDHLENAGAADCLGQGAWSSDRDTISEPMVNAVWALTSSITSGGDPSAEEPPTGITLDAHGYKEKGKHHIDLTWSGFDPVTVTSVDIFEGGVRVAGASVGDSPYTYAPGRSGGGTFTYVVCAAGDLGACSNQATVTF